MSWKTKMDGVRIEGTNVFRHLGMDRGIQRYERVPINLKENGKSEILLTMK